VASDQPERAGAIALEEWGERPILATQTSLLQEPQNMDIEALAAFLYTQLPGEIAEPIGDKIDGWSPEPAKCHDNAAAWVALNSTHRMVPGWMPTPGVTTPNRLRFASHTVIETETGQLLDVTLGARDAGYGFIRHPWAEDEFFAAVRDNGMPTIDHVMGPDPEIDHSAPMTDAWSNFSGHF